MTDKESEDPRLDHIKNVTMNLLNLSESHWAELIWKEENQAIIKEFLDSPTSVLLLFFLDQNEKLILSLEMPSPRYIPEIMAYFMKSNISVSTENHKREIMFGSVCSYPLDQYQNLFEKVLCPVFSNKLNNKRWPADIANEIILHLQDFRKTLMYHVGLAQGKTALVISDMAKLIENFSVDEISSDDNDWKLRDILNSVTDMLCDWIPVIKEVLEVTSENILSKVQQGPATEIKFWYDRKINLEFVQKQLNDPIIEKMVLALEKTNNCHFPLFKDLLQDVAEALTEATEICNSLSAMSDHLQNLEICKFSELKEKLPDTMEKITSSWTSSNYFKRVPSRISVLIKKSCFFLIEKVEEFLNPSKLFKENQQEMKEKVEICIETCNAFLKSYCRSRENYNQEIYPWEFPDKRVFDSFETFLERLHKIYEIFEAYDLYCSVPEYKILGVPQMPFKTRLEDLSTSFKECYKVFVESTYNPLDLTSDAFLLDCNLFSLKLDELDHKLGTALSQTCLSCITSEDSFKLMNIIQDLLKRPLVHLEFKKLVTSLLRNVHMELLAAKESYDNLSFALNMCNQVTYKNLAPASGVLQCSMDLQKKLSFPVDSLQQIQHYLINASDVDLILRTYKEMDELLSKFQIEIFQKWQIALDIVNKQMDQPLFFTDEKNNLLINFAPQIQDIVQEIQYIKMIKKTNLLPADSLNLHDTLKKILLAHSMLACTTCWYNNLVKNLMDLEKLLIKDDWEKICDDVKKGLEEKWTKSDLQEYSENIYQTTKSLFERVNQAKENVREVQLFMETWNKSPVFVRDTPDSLVNFDMFMTSKMRQQIYHVIETSINLSRVMEENMLLFKCDSESEEWKSYVLYLDSILEDGLKDSIHSSLKYLLENIDSKNKKLAPFYKIRMILKDDIDFMPPLDQYQQGNFFQLFEALIERIYCPASQIKRMANSEADYLEAMTENNDLTYLKNRVNCHIESGINKTLDQVDNYLRYSDLWLQNIETALEDFILYGPLPDTKPDEDTEQLEMSLEIKPPTEEEFRSQISQFDKLQKNIEDLSSEILVESWLLLDTTPFKDTLLTLVRNWSSAYKKKLVELKSQGKLRKVDDDGNINDMSSHYSKLVLKTGFSLKMFTVENRISSTWSTY